MQYVLQILSSKIHYLHQILPHHCTFHVKQTPEVASHNGNSQLSAQEFKQLCPQNPASQVASQCLPFQPDLHLHIPVVESQGPDVPSDLQSQWCLQADP